ncbi:hypothetical protein AB0B45_51060 [Nonomuraea sp. NPDC049152]|uniref:hypothetical protein n=1 Tax=Nonomuraea sp. NPDC049152 TaxID=3154350 RepID=UPI0033C32B96
MSEGHQRALPGAVMMVGYRRRSRWFVLGFPEFDVAAHAALDAGEDAWPRLRDALVHWRPLHEDHLASIALLADPRAAHLITPERGRELLAMRRG